MDNEIEIDWRGLFSPETKSKEYENAINVYCKSFCIQECSIECPLYKFKSNEEEDLEI